MSDSSGASADPLQDARVHVSGLASGLGGGVLLLFAVVLCARHRAVKTKTTTTQNLKKHRTSEDRPSFLNIMPRRQSQFSEVAWDVSRSISMGPKVGEEEEMNGLGGDGQEDAPMSFSEPIPSLAASASSRTVSPCLPGNRESVVTQQSDIHLACSDHIITTLPTHEQTLAVESSPPMSPLPSEETVSGTEPVLAEAEPAAVDNPDYEVVSQRVKENIAIRVRSASTHKVMNSLYASLAVPKPASSDSDVPSSTSSAPDSHAHRVVSSQSVLSVNDNPYAKVSALYVKRQKGVDPSSRDIAKKVRKRSSSISSSVSIKMSASRLKSIRAQYSKLKKDLIDGGKESSPSMYALPRGRSASTGGSDDKPRRSSVDSLLETVSSVTSMAVTPVSAPPTPGKRDGVYARPDLPEKTADSLLTASPYATAVSRERRSSETSLPKDAGASDGIAPDVVEDPYAQPTLPKRTEESMCLDRSLSSGSESLPNILTPIDLEDANYSCPADILMKAGCDATPVKRRESMPVTSSQTSPQPVKSPHVAMNPAALARVEENYARPADALGLGSAPVHPSVARRLSGSSLPSLSRCDSTFSVAATPELAGIPDDDGEGEDPYAFPADSVQAEEKRKVAAQRLQDPYAAVTDTLWEAGQLDRELELVKEKETDDPYADPADTMREAGVLTLDRSKRDDSYARPSGALIETLLSSSA